MLPFTLSIMRSWRTELVIAFIPPMSPVDPACTLYSQFPFIPALFFFNDTATTEIYTLSLPDALPISAAADSRLHARAARDEPGRSVALLPRLAGTGTAPRSEEHTSALQSHSDLVCRLLLEKKNRNMTTPCLLLGT